MPKATVAKHSAIDCPVLDGTVRKEFRHAAKTANTFSAATVAWLDKREAKMKATWLKTTIQQSRQLFNPWTIEVLFLLSVLGPMRFSELERTLDVSSRTLSDRLRSLKDRGLVTRTLHDEQPVRVEYTITVKGRKTAALAAPLIAHLNLEALKEVGKI